jgi:hypothetical protein
MRKIRNAQNEIEPRFFQTVSFDRKWKNSAKQGVCPPYFDKKITKEKKKSAQFRFGCAGG